MNVALGFGLMYGCLLLLVAIGLMKSWRLVGEARQRLRRIAFWSFLATCCMGALLVIVLLNTPLNSSFPWSETWLVDVGGLFVIVWFIRELVLFTRSRPRRSPLHW
jgi:tellurite resistance protein TehA-like permease